MKTFVIIFSLILAVSFSSSAQDNTYLKITVDSKMLPIDHGLGGGGGLPATANKVYAHLGLCTCKMDGTGATATRNCADSLENVIYCHGEVTPYKSNVWQHVVGNWGDNPQDDGVGEMTDEGDGVYSIEFIIEEYFTDPAIVSTESEATDVIPSSPWVPANGGNPHVIGMVFRNEDGTLDGRDEQGGDIFLINIQGTPTVVQSSLPGEPFPAVTVVINSADVDEIDRVINSAKVYPNPFSNKATITYYLSAATNTLDISIYNVLGKKVKTLETDDETVGINEIEWDGTDDNGNSISNGMYIIKITSDNNKVITKNVLFQR